MNKSLFAIALFFVSLTGFTNQMSASPGHKGFEIPTDLEGSRRDYQKQSRVSYNAEPDAQQPPEKEASKPAPKKPNIHNGAGTQRRSGGMRY